MLILLSAEPISLYVSFPVLFIFLEFTTALFYWPGFCFFFINNLSHILHRKWKAPLKNILYLVKCFRSSISSAFVFIWKFPKWIFPVLMWAGFSLGLLHCCHLEIFLHCHPRTFFCFSSVFDAISRIPYILLSWFMPTWYFVLEILDWESFPSEFWRN